MALCPCQTDAQKPIPLEEERKELREDHRPGGGCRQPYKAAWGRRQASLVGAGLGWEKEGLGGWQTAPIHRGILGGLLYCSIVSWCAGLEARGSCGCRKVTQTTRTRKLPGDRAVAPHLLSQRHHRVALCKNFVCKKLGRFFLKVSNNNTHTHILPLLPSRGIWLIKTIFFFDPELTRWTGPGPGQVAGPVQANLGTGLCTPRLCCFSCSFARGLGGVP